jgi:hypothetical protein
MTPDTALVAALVLGTAAGAVWLVRRAEAQRARWRRERDVVRLDDYRGRRE